MKLPLLLSIFTILITFHNSSNAQSRDEWFTGVTDSGDKLFYAATMNESGNILGQYCDPSTGNCIWLLGMSTVCKEGDQYPVLANSDASSAHILVYCSARLDNGHYRYVFTEFDVINNIVMKGVRVGFAVPLQADQFRVVRFNLSGSNRAIASMRAAAEKIQKKSSSKSTGTKDQDL